MQEQNLTQMVRQHYFATTMHSKFAHHITPQQFTHDSLSKKKKKQFSHDSELHISTMHSKWAGPSI